MENHSRLQAIVHYAGDYFWVNELIHQEARVNSPVTFSEAQQILDADGDDTPLHVAARSNNLEMVKTELNHSPDVNLQNHVGNTPLHVAVRLSNLDMVMALLSHSPDVNMSNREEETPLHLAVRLRNLHMVQALLEHSAGVNLCNQRSHTPLHIAAAIGRLDIATVLLNHIGEFNTDGSMSVTPLHSAAKYGCTDVMTLLLDRGGNVHARDGDGQQPLHVAAQYGHTEMITLLLRRRANKKAKDKNRLNSLHLAVRFGHLKAVEILIGYGASGQLTNQSVTDTNGEPYQEYISLVNSKDDIGRNLLESAIYESQVDIVELLVKVKKQFGFPDVADYYVLPCAIYSLMDGIPSQDGERVIEILLKSNIFDTNAMDDWRARTALHHITEQDNPDFHHLDNVFKMLLECQTAVNQTDNQGNTALMIAAERGYDHYIQLLLDWSRKKGKKLLLDLRNFTGKTALMEAVINCRQRAVELLVSNGASVNIPDDRGFTPLHAAMNDWCMFWPDFEYYSSCCHDDDRNSLNVGVLFDANRALKCHNDYVASKARNKDEMVKIILNSGTAEVNVRDFEGNTPLDLAYHFRNKINLSTIEALQNNGAVINKRMYHNQHMEHEIDSWDRTPLHRAVITLLLNRRDEDTSSESELWSVDQLPEMKGQAEFEVYYQRWQKYFEIMSKILELPLESVKKWTAKKDNRGRTVFHYVAMLSDHRFERQTWIRNVFSNFDVDINAIDNFGRTPLHYAEDDKIYTDLIELGANENVKDVEGHTPKYLQDLLQSVPKLEHVNLRNRLKFISELNKINEKAKAFVERITYAIGQLDYRFRCKSHLVGSSSDGTKIEIPGDFDFALTLIEISKRCEYYQSPETPSGCVQLRRKGYESEGILYRRTDDFDVFFDDEQFLRVSEVKYRFKVILRTVLGDPTFWRDEDTFEMRDNLGMAIANRVFEIPLCVNAEVKLSMIHPLKDESSGLYRYFTSLSFDLVPYIYLKAWLPDGVPSHVKNEVTIPGCSVVFTKPNQDYPWVPFAEKFARISFAMAEIDLVKNGSGLSRAALLVARTLLSYTIDDDKHQKSRQYVLKSCFLYCIEALDARGRVQDSDEQSQDFNPEELYYWVERILFCLSLFCDHDFVPSYCMPSCPLPIEVSLKREHMDCFAQKGRKRKFVSAAHKLYMNLFPDKSKVGFCNCPIQPIRECFDREVLLKKIRGEDVHCPFGDGEDAEENVDCENDSDDDYDDEDNDDDRSHINFFEFLVGNYEDL